MRALHTSGLRAFGLCGVLSITLLAGHASADSRSHAAQAERFLELVNADRIAVPVYAQVQQMFAERFAQTQAPESKRGLLESYQSKADAALDKAIGWEEVKGQGRIFSWTRMWHPVHPALKGRGAYVTVLVELPHAGNIRMIGNLLGDPMQKVEIGTMVEAVFEHHETSDPPFSLLHWKRAA